MLRGCLRGLRVAHRVTLGPRLWSTANGAVGRCTWVALFNSCCKQESLVVDTGLQVVIGTGIQLCVCAHACVACGGAGWLAVCGWLWVIYWAKPWITDCPAAGCVCCFGVGGSFSAGLNGFKAL